MSTLTLLSIFSFFTLTLTVYFAYRAHQNKRLLNKITEDVNKEITDRLHAEEAKLKLEKALLQGQKLQAIGTLAGGIAHDFNNILYAILGYVDMAREDTPKDSLTYDNLGKVLLAAQRGQELISRILSFSRRQHHDLTNLCLKETIEGVLELLKPTIPASVTINFSINLGGRSEILGNQTQLHQIIVNIINNAVDAMDDEGIVNITLNRVLLQDKIRQELPKMKPCNYYRMDIADTGHGMDQSMIARIFEPFFTTKEVGKGTGLGLSTVHAIVEEHDGEIQVRSQLGRGTTFTILFPEHINKESSDG